MATETLKIKDLAEEAEHARAVARRYCCEFVDLKTTKIDHELFRTIPVDLMFRYHFVPLQAQNGTLEIALSDPRQIVSIDELSVLLDRASDLTIEELRARVASLEDGRRGDPIQELIDRGRIVELDIPTGRGAAESRVTSRATSSGSTLLVEKNFRSPVSSVRNSSSACAGCPSRPARPTSWR